MKNSTFFIGFGATAAIIGAAVFASYKIQTHIETKTIEVVSKERLMSVSSTDGKTKTKFENFVYSEDEVYWVRDSIWNWHFRAMTVYASIPESGTCEVTLSGYRWGYLSMAQNIIDADCTESNK